MNSEDYSNKNYNDIKLDVYVLDSFSSKIEKTIHI